MIFFMDNIIKTIEANFLKDEYFFNGPCLKETVVNAEKTLEVYFPKTYREFLEKFGSGGVLGGYIYGIGRNDLMFNMPIPEVTAYHVVWSNLYERRNGLHPKHLISIYSVGEGTTYCLDTSQMNAEGECPVVAWPLGGYETTPVLEVVAPDFGTFFLNLVEREIEWKKEREQAS